MCQPHCRVALVGVVNAVFLYTVVWSGDRWGSEGPTVALCVGPTPTLFRAWVRQIALTPKWWLLNNNYTYITKVTTVLLLNNVFMSMYVLKKRDVSCLFNSIYFNDRLVSHAQNMHCVPKSSTPNSWHRLTLSTKLLHFHVLLCYYIACFTSNFLFTFNQHLFLICHWCATDIVFLLINAFLKLPT